MIKFTCPHCGQNIEAEDAAAGITIACPNSECAQSFVIPEPVVCAAPVPAAPVQSSRMAAPPRAVSQRPTPLDVGYMPVDRFRITRAGWLLAVTLCLYGLTNYGAAVSTRTFLRALGPDRVSQIQRGEKPQVNQIEAITLQQLQESVKFDSGCARFFTTVFGVVLIWFISKLRKAWVLIISWSKLAGVTPSISSSNLALWIFCALIPLINILFMFRCFDIGRDLVKIFDGQRFVRTKCKRWLGIASAASVVAALLFSIFMSRAVIGGLSDPSSAIRYGVVLSIPLIMQLILIPAFASNLQTAINRE